MPEISERDTKLIQYLNDAYGKERQLETDLQAHIGMTTKAAYKKRLQQHLQETKRHAREVERRIKRLGGDTGGAVHAAVSVASKGMAVARGPLHMVRGTSEQEMLLKNAQTEYSEEHHEIATYTTIEALADSVGDRETAQLARAIRRDEDRMARYLERLIPQLTKAVARAEIPSSQRNGGGRRRTRSRRRGAARASTGGTRRSRSSTGSRARSGSRTRS
jgi:ferritin-like metal-binding protein YciE